MAGKKKKLLVFGVLNLMLSYLVISSLYFTAHYLYRVAFSPSIAQPVILKETSVVDNLVINDVVSDDVMPAYFDLTQLDMVPQYTQHLHQTKQIMRARKDRVREWCKVNKVKKRSFLSSMLGYSQHPHYHFPNNLNWCPVFKAGSTNWKQFFCKIYRPEVYKEALENADYCHIDELKKYILAKPGKQGLTFLTVRHPYERLVSAYRNKFEDCKEGMFIDSAMVTILNKYRAVDATLTKSVKYAMLNAAKAQCWTPVSERDIDADNPYMNPMGLTFREFVQHVIQQYKGGVEADPHWEEVAERCDVCNVEYHVIERFDTLERDHHYLLTKLGHAELYSEIVGRHGNPSSDVTASTGASNTVREYLNMLDKVMLWDLVDVYKRDFELFGYAPHITLRNDPRGRTIVANKDSNDLISNL